MLDKLTVTQRDGRGTFFSCEELGGVALSTIPHSLLSGDSVAGLVKKAPLEARTVLTLYYGKVSFGSVGVKPFGLTFFNYSELGPADFV